MNYGEVLSRAWQIIWKHKILWIFGILAGCGTSGGGAGNFQTSFRGELPPRIQRSFEGIGQIPEWQIALLVGILIIVILILIVVAIFLGTIGRIGLVRGTQQADQGIEPLLFSDLFNGSLSYFWRVFGLNLLVGIAGFIAVLLLIVPFVFLAVITLGLGVLCIIPLICILVPLAWLVGVIIEQANIAIVVENVGIMEGLRHGWEIFRANLGTMIVMALILYLGVNLIGGFLIGLPLALVVAPVIAGALTGGERAFGGGLLVSALCFVAYLPVLIVLSGILRGYIESGWTLAYLRLRETSL